MFVSLFLWSGIYFISCFFCQNLSVFGVYKSVCLPTWFIMLFIPTSLLNIRSTKHECYILNYKPWYILVDFVYHCLVDFIYVCILSRPIYIYPLYINIIDYWHELTFSINRIWINQAFSLYYLYLHLLITQLRIRSRSLSMSVTCLIRRITGFVLNCTRNTIGFKNRAGSAYPSEAPEISRRIFLFLTL